MSSILRTTALLTLTTLLASCGGGDSAPTIQQVTQLSSATCDSSTLWAAHPTASGSAIPDNNTTGISVTWDNQNCALQAVSSATLEICLNHPRTSDLVWTITPPASATALTVTAPSNWNTTASSCDSGQGKFQRIDLLPTISSSATTRGIWTLKVKDQNSGDAGTLIQWRVLIQGTR